MLLATSYVLLGTLLRLGLLVATAGSVSWGLPTFAALFIGLLFDLFMAWFLTLPLGLLSAVWPASWSVSRWLRLPLHAAWIFGAFLFTFWKISEILFWEEFGVRFNFIAVDYLVYTTEVVKNIVESYNLPLIISIVLAVATGFFLLWRRLGFVRRWEEGAAADATPRLFMNLLPRDRDDIAVVGLIQPDSGQWGITDLQAALVARMARAAQHAPRAAAWLYRLRQRPEPASPIRYVDSPRHALEVEHYSYRRRLERLIASLDRRLRREASPRLATSRSGRR